MAFFGGLSSEETEKIDRYTKVYGEILLGMHNDIKEYKDKIDSSIKLYEKFNEKTDNKLTRLTEVEKEQNLIFQNVIKEKKVYLSELEIKDKQISKYISELNISSSEFGGYVSDLKQEIASLKRKNKESQISILELNSSIKLYDEFNKKAEMQLIQVTKIEKEQNRILQKYTKEKSDFLNLLEIKDKQISEYITELNTNNSQIVGYISELKDEIATLNNINIKSQVSISELKNKFNIVIGVLVVTILLFLGLHFKFTIW